MVSRARRVQDSDDDEENLIVPTRTRPSDGRTLSAKQQVIKEAGHQQQIEALKRQLKKAEKAAKVAANGPRRSNSTNDDDDNEYESEEEDPDDARLFPSSIRPIGSFDASPQRAPLRKSGTARTPFQPLDNDEGNASGRGRSHERPSLSAHSGRREPATSPPRSSSPALEFPESTPAPPASRKRAASRSLSPAPSRKHVKKVQWLNGQPPTGRAKARDYEPDVYNIIIHACHDYSARVCARDSLPNAEVQLTWARAAWDDACKEVEEEYQITDRILGLIKTRGSNARAAIKDAVRPKIPSTFGFTHTDNINGKVGRRNRKIYAALVEENAFHYKNTEDLTGFCQNKLISEAIQAAWFDSKTSLGVEFLKYFKPISLVTLALTLTAIEFCIEEWSTGVFVKAAFNEKSNTERYKSHLADVTEWRNSSDVVVDKICEKISNRALRSAGATALEPATRVSNEARLRAKKELEGRTGDTDSEGDEGSDDE